MAADPFASTSDPFGSSSGVKWGGGGKTATTPKVTSKTISKTLRDAIGSGDVAKVARLARRAGVNAQDRKGLVTSARLLQPHHGLVGKIGSDITSTVRGLPKGLARLGASAAKEVVAPTLIPVHLAQGKHVGTDELIGSIPGPGQIYSAAKAGITNKPLPSNPFSSGIGQSFRHTALRVAHPKQALRDYSQHPFNTALEDVGNLAVVAGAASKAASLAGASTTAERLATLSRAGVDVANVPFLPVSATARGANALLGKLAESKLARSELATSFRLSPEARQITPLLRTGQEAETAFFNRSGKGFLKQAKLLPSDAEQQAAMLVNQQELHGAAVARATLPRPQFIEYLDRTFGKDFSPKTVELALDAVSGKNPELMNRIAKAAEIGRPGRQLREAGYLSRGPGTRSEQLGFGPLSDVVAARLEKPATQLAKAQKVVEQLQLKADANRGRLSQAQLEAEHVNVPAVQQIGETGQVSHYVRSDVGLARSLGRQEARQTMLDNAAARASRVVDRLKARVESTRANAEYSVAAAPARLRPTLQANRDAASAIAAHVNGLRREGLHAEAAQVERSLSDIPTTLDAMEKAGINPEHFINPREYAKGGSVPSGELSLPRAKKTLGEARQRKMVGAHDMELPAQFRAEVGRANEVIQRQTVEKISQLPFVQKGIKFIKSDGTFPTRAELVAQGLDSWTPAGLFQRTDKIGANTLIMPKGLLDAFEEYYKPAKFEKLFQATYDPLTRAFKTVVLPLSVSWNVGNAITNAFMAMFGGGVAPWTLAREMGSTINQLRKTGEWNVPDSYLQRGATFEARDMFAGRTPQELTGIRQAGHIVNTPLRKLTQAGYGLNQTVDNIFRSAVYNAKLKAGYSPEVAMKIGLRAMGDFTRMSPFEKNVVRRAIPFYAWLRHMSQFALRLPIEHPLRTAWVLSMSNEFKDQQAWEHVLPGFLQGFVPLGGDNALSVQNFMPFSNPLAISQLGSNLSPQIKLLLANAPFSPARGINAFTGRPYTRRPGTGRQDAFGREQPTAPSLLEQLRQIPPQARLLDTLTGRKDVARYESGQTVLTRGSDGKLHTIPIPQSTLTALSKYAGVPITSQKQLQAIADSIISKRVATYKSAHRKKKLVTSSSGGGWTPPKTTGGLP